MILIFPEEPKHVWRGAGSISGPRFDMTLFQKLQFREKISLVLFTAAEQICLSIISKTCMA